MSRDLCTLSDITQLIPGYKEGDDADTDALLAEFITETSRFAMEDTGREFTAITGLNPRSFDVDMTVAKHRRLFIGDLAAVAAVNVYDGPGNLIQAINPANIVLEPRVREDWQPIASLWFRIDAATVAPLVPGYVVSVNGTWGFPSVPETVKMAVARLVVVRYVNDAAAQGTQLADAANRGDFNLGVSIRVALDALQRFYVPLFQGTLDSSPAFASGVAGVDW